MSGSILVVGSANTDMVVRTETLPAPGQTVLGGTFLMNPGGKGANQAVAAARLGGRVTLVAKLGNDLFGQQARTGFEQEGIRTDYVLTDRTTPSGVALINVDAQGENCIAVAPGANAHLHPNELDAAIQAADADTVVLFQLEIPLETVRYGVRLATARRLRVLLNPAPARPLPADLLQHLFLISPNETEAELLTKIRITDQESTRQAARHLHEQGVQHVLITLGAKGAYLSANGSAQFIEGVSVTAVDTTAAGDCFNGALAVALAEGSPLPDAVRFAARAAAISVTRMGAQAAMPRRNEL